MAWTTASRIGYDGDGSKSTETNLVEEPMSRTPRAWRPIVAGTLFAALPLAILACEKVEKVAEVVQQQSEIGKALEDRHDARGHSLEISRNAGGGTRATLKVEVPGNRAAPTREDAEHAARLLLDHYPDDAPPDSIAVEYRAGSTRGPLLSSSRATTYYFGAADL